MKLSNCLFAFLFFGSFTSAYILKRLVNKLYSRGLSEGFQENSYKIQDNARNTEAISTSASLLEKLKQQFYRTMYRADVPLFNDFSTYLDTLPVRELAGKYVRLYSLPFYAHKDDLKSMAMMLVDKDTTGNSRHVVPFLCAPTCSGKTASILPAFLESCEMEKGFTHYLYIASANNGNRNFKVSPSDPSSNEILALDQGAAFMAECVKVLLENPSSPGPFEIQLNLDPPKFSETQENLSKYLLDKFGSKSKLLIHLDEHSKMCYRQATSTFSEFDPSACFTRGAMEVLAKINMVTVVATYLDPPPIPPMGSSNVCRFPIPIPPLDIDQVMDNIEELRFPLSSGFSEGDFRRWLTLRLCLMRKIFDIGIVPVLHKLVTSEITPAEVFKLEFANAKSKAEKNIMEAFRECFELCQVDLPDDDHSVDIAARLVASISDRDMYGMKRQFSDIAIVSNRRYSASLFSLLTMVDPNVPVFNTGRDLVLNALSSDAAFNSPDYQSNHPLEAMYIWALACNSAVSGCLNFYLTLNSGGTGTHVYLNIKCNSLRPGRLFPNTNNDVFSPPFNLPPHVMYYAEDTNGLSTHPLCNIFFGTTDDELFIIDITVGKDTIVEEKAAKLAEWIKKVRAKTDLRLCGIVIAPLAKGYSTDDTSTGVITIRGKDAKRGALGGLSQFFRYISQSDNASTSDITDRGKDARRGALGASLSQFLRWIN